MYHRKFSFFTGGGSAAAAAGSPVCSTVASVVAFISVSAALAFGSAFAFFLLSAAPAFGDFVSGSASGVSTGASGEVSTAAAVSAGASVAPVSSASVAADSVAADCSRSSFIPLSILCLVGYCNPPSLPSRPYTPTLKMKSTTKKNSPNRKTATITTPVVTLTSFRRRRNDLAHLRAHIAQKAW